MHYENWVPGQPPTTWYFVSSYTCFLTCVVDDQLCASKGSRDKACYHLHTNKHFGEIEPYGVWRHCQLTMDWHASFDAWLIVEITAHALRRTSVNEAKEDVVFWKRFNENLQTVEGKITCGCHCIPVWSISLFIRVGARFVYFRHFVTHLPVYLPTNSL